MQYKVNAIDDQPPKEWKGPNGTVYYIVVGLEGHVKPVSIGKKSPDALKVGDTVHGDIIPTDYLTDKWKPSPPPSTYSGTPKSDTAYLKDISDLPRSFIIELLKYYDVQSLYNSPKYAEMIKLAKSLNDDAMAMILANRSGSQTSSTQDSVTKAPSPTAATEPSIKEKASRWASSKTITANEGEPPYGDDDYQGEDE